MKSLLTQGLNTQKLITKANSEALTNADVNKINKAGLRLVHKPDAPKSNLVSLDERRVMAAHTSPEAA
jgi:hypothetical protein